MALKAILASLEGLDEALKPLYKKDEDGKYHLDVDGLVDKAKLDEFRSNNTGLKEQVEKLTKDMAAFGGIDPAKYKEFMAKFESDEEKKLMKNGDIDAVVQLRTEKMRKDFEEQIKAKDGIILKAQETSKVAQHERDNYIVESELRKSVDNPELGFQNGVVDLVKEQVLKEFAYKDGKVIRVKADGSPVFGAKGDPATIGEFLQDIVKDRPYLVKASTGSGARPGAGANANGAKSMTRGAFDKMTPQAQMDFSKSKGVLTE